MSTFFGIELGRRAIAAFRRAVDVTGHNVANSNTPGYHAQSPLFEATYPYDVPMLYKSVGAYQVGTGMQVASIDRLYDMASELRIRTLLSTQQSQDVSLQFLGQIESITAMNGGLSDKLSAFFSAWQDVADAPESIAARAVVVQRGITLSSEINYVQQSIMDARNDTDDYVQQSISEVNALLVQVRDLNVLIRQVSATGDNPNDLLDKRDYALNQLSELVNIQVVNGSNNSIMVFIGGKAVVQDDEYTGLVGVSDPANYNYVDVRFSDAPAGPDVVINDGKLKGLLDTRDSATSGLLYYKTQLDTFATNLIATINTQHAAPNGWDLDGNAGANFFDPVGIEPALGIQVTANLLAPNGARLIAASSTLAGVPGNGVNALAIADLANTSIVGLGNVTFSEYFNQLVTNIGSNVAELNTKKSHTDGLIDQLENMRDSVSGVSLDEEATYLMQFQKSYEAAARIITTYDEMYDEILKLIG